MLNIVKLVVKLHLKQGILIILHTRCVNINVKPDIHVIKAKCNVDVSITSDQLLFRITGSNASLSILLCMNSTEVERVQFLFRIWVGFSNLG